VQLRHLRNQLAVHFLWVRIVRSRPQARFDMRQPRPGIAGRQGTGERRTRVALHHDPRRPRFPHHVRQRRHQPPNHRIRRGRHHPQIMIRPQPEPGQGFIKHLTMLPGRNKQWAVPTRLQIKQQRCQLDRLRPRTRDKHDWKRCRTQAASRHHSPPRSD